MNHVTSPPITRALATWWRTPGATDLAACALYLAFAAWVGHGLWPDPATRALALNVDDQILNEWFLAHGVLFWTGDHSLISDRLNSPDGVNLMGNASLLLQGVVLAPVTVLFGAPVSFAVLIVLNLAATAAGWYLLFARGLGRDRVAAAVGGLVAGFGPGMVSQSNSHPHITTQWLVPLIVWFVIRLTRVYDVRPVIVASLGLAAAICLQAFGSEEILFLTALTLALFTPAYAALRWRWARRVGPTVVSGLMLAASVSGLVLLYPLWVQFGGPMRIPSAPFSATYFYADLIGFLAYSPLSIAGSAEALRLASGPSELNTFLGVPLILLLLALVVWRRRSPAVVAAGVVSVVMAYLAMGVFVMADGEPTGWPSLYAPLADVPVIGSALPTRYALALLPLAAVILVDAIEAGLAAGGTAATVLAVAVAAALVPLAPRPLPAIDREPLPSFITTGAWRQCVPEGGVLVPVPMPSPNEPETMRWASAANAAFGLPQGFFIGAYGANGGASVGVFPEPTSRLLAGVAETGVVPPITDDDRDRARRDLSLWRADCVALADGPQAAALRSTLEQLLGPATPIADVWAWPVAR